VKKLVVGQAQTVSTELLSEDTVLLEQVVDDFLLPAVDPASEGEQQECLRGRHGVHLGIFDRDAPRCK